MAKPETLAKVRRFVQTYVRKGPFTLYPSDEVVENVIIGLADNVDEHGKMYWTKGHEMVCPCTPHSADIARQGYCDCALFASHDFVAQEKEKEGK